MSRRFTQILFLLVFLSLSVFIGAPSVAKNPATLPTETDAITDETFNSIEPLLGTKGEKHNGVLTMRIPRTDLEGRLFNELGDIPIAAGIESRFDFFKCPCGKVNVIGQFVVTQDESNDVIDALRKTYYIKIVSISPMMLSRAAKCFIQSFTL